ncbi:MAG: hypothetical protein KDC49_12515 [Saprospiraceae bacterium]|nr:hypothetical protein [Saprospiraceae bacterium]
MPTTNITDLSSLYKLEINNTGSQVPNAYLELELRQGNKLLYQSRSKVFQVLPAVNALNEQLLQPIQVTLNEVEILSGSYHLDVRLMDGSSNQILTSERFFLEALLSSPGNNKMQDWVKFDYSGSASFYGQVSNMQGFGSEVPRNYLRAEIHPEVSLSGIPLGADVLLSTEQNAFKQSMNQVALRFDAQQFKNEMQKRLQSKIKDIEAIGSLEEFNQLNALKQKVMERKFPGLSGWEKELGSEEVKNGLQQIKQYESLHQILTNPEVQSTINRHAELLLKSSLSPEDSEELKKLDAFVDEIKKLQSKAEALKSVYEKYNHYKELQQKIDQARKFASKDIIKDEGFLKEGMKSLGFLSKPQELLKGFDAISIGTSYPYYSRLSLNSLSVNGVHLAWNPGKVYFSATYGMSSRMTYNTDFINPILQLPQRALATRLGYGSPQGNHFHVTYMDVTDKFDELIRDNRTKPQQNRLIGTSGQLTLMDDKLKVGGEVMASLLTRDHILSTELSSIHDKNVIYRLLGKSNNSSSFDLAWRIFSDVNLFNNKTKIKAFVERVGANYYSLGAPTLLNNLLRWKTELRQSFLKNKVSISAFARQDNNNLDPLLISSRNTTQSYGVSGMVSLPEWPSLSFSYAPYAQNAEMLATKEDFKTNARLTQISIVYPMRFGESFSSYSQLSYTGQNMTSDLGAIDYSLKMYGLSQTISVKRNSINFSLNYTPNQLINQVSREVMSLTGSGSTVVMKKLNASLGVQYLSVSGIESRTGYFINGSYPIASFADLDLRVQRNIYNVSQENLNGADAVAWLGLRIKW